MRLRGRASDRKSDSWYIIAIITGMGMPHFFPDALADSYHSGFSWNMAHKFSGFRRLLPVHPEKQRASRHRNSSARSLLPDANLFDSGNPAKKDCSIVILAASAYGRPSLCFPIRVVPAQSSDHLISTLPHVNPAPKAESTSQSPGFSIFFPYASDMAKGMVAAVVFP